MNTEIKFVEVIDDELVMVSEQSLRNFHSFRNELEKLIEKIVFLRKGEFSYLDTYYIGEENIHVAGKTYDEHSDDILENWIILIPFESLQTTENLKDFNRKMLNERKKEKEEEIQKWLDKPREPTIYKR